MKAMLWNWNNKHKKKLKKRQDAQEKEIKVKLITRSLMKNKILKAAPVLMVALRINKKIRMTMKVWRAKNRRKLLRRIMF